MLEESRKFWLFYLLLIIVVFDFFIFFYLSQKSQYQFTFATLDVGQGDALFIESPTGTQMLVDGGPPKKILSELSKVMSPFDKEIDAIMITNPDQDHIAGFLDVLDVYDVKVAFESGTLNESQTFENLKLKLKEKNIPIILAKKGMQFDFGGETRMDILFPDRDVSSWSTNDGSIVARLSFSNFGVMLTGDSTLKTEKLIVSENKIEDLDSTILKVGHHGSRTSTGEAFLKNISPMFAIISSGEDNKYGHPHQEVLGVLGSFESQVFRTDILGTIVFKSDGTSADFSFFK